MAVFGNRLFFSSQLVLFLVLNCGLLLPSVRSVAALADAIQPAKNEVGKIQIKALLNVILLGICHPGTTVPS